MDARTRPLAQPKMTPQLLADVPVPMSIPALTPHPPHRCHYLSRPQCSVPCSVCRSLHICVLVPKALDN